MHDFNVSCLYVNVWLNFKAFQSSSYCTNQWIKEFIITSDPLHNMCLSCNIELYSISLIKIECNGSIGIHRFLSLIRIRTYFSALNLRMY